MRIAITKLFLSISILSASCNAVDKKPGNIMPVVMDQRLIDSIKNNALSEKEALVNEENKKQDDIKRLHQAAVAKENDRKMRDRDMAAYEDLITNAQTELTLEEDKLEQAKQPVFLRSSSEREAQIRPIVESINSYKSSIRNAQSNIQKIKAGKKYLSITENAITLDTAAF